MRTKIVALISLGTIMAAAVAASLQPLKVKTGLWQMVETVTWTGLPPQMAAAMGNGRTHSYQSCVKPEDLSSNPWANGSHESCMWTVLNSTGTDMEVRGTSCDMGRGVAAELHGKIHVLDSENGTAAFDLLVNANGQTMNGHASYVGKWIGSSCPAE